MNVRSDQLRNVVTSIAIVAVTLAAVWAAIAFGKLALFGVIAVVALVLGAYVGVRHPLWLFYALAAVMAALQFGRIPGANLPIYLPLEFGALVAAYFHPRLARSMHPLEFAVLALVITSGLSVLATGFSFAAASLFIRWAIPTLLMLALVRLRREDLVRFGQVFVVFAALNALYGLYVVAFDPLNTSLKYLRVFGYSPEATAARFAFTALGGSGSVRLGGTWVEPNAAALNLVLALALAILLFAGWRRVLLTAVIALALVLTLSRGSLFSVVFGILLVLVFHSMRVRNRAAMMGIIALGATSAMLIEPVRTRIVTAFRGDDAGSVARVEALRDFPGRMAGHWGFGAGWARPEFIDPQFAYAFNLPSNAPLVALYRGGILVEVAFLAVVVIGCVMGYRALRSQSTPNAIYGGLFIGICVVQMNLDHNFADVPQAAVLYSIFLAFLVYVYEARNSAQDKGEDDGEVRAKPSLPDEAVTLRA